MMRNQFGAEMTALHTKMITMGALCESGIASAVKGLLEHDPRNTQRAIDLVEEVNQCEQEIEQLCHTLLLRQQPVARDLRKISACLKMVTDMERIGDQAGDIAEIARLKNTPPDDGGKTIKDMSIACIGMVTDCIDAFVQQDIALAHKVVGDDDAVDRYFDHIKQTLAEKIAGNLTFIEGYIDLLMVAKYLERIADHAVNIADWVVYIETAERSQKGEAM